jgi:hypothetical protein
MFGKIIIAFRLNDHTLMWIIPMSPISRSRSILCYGHNKWLGWATYTNGRHKQLNFDYQCSFFSHKCQVVSCWCLTFLFLVSPLRWTTWNHHFFPISSTFNPSKWFHSTNSRSFQMPNTRNAKIKSRRLGRASCKRQFFEYMYMANFLNLF